MKKIEDKDYRYLDQLPDSAMLAISEVLALLRISRSTWYAGIKTGRYPASVPIGPSSPRWRLGDIRKVAAGTFGIDGDSREAA